MYVCVHLLDLTESMIVSLTRIMQPTGEIIAEVPFDNVGSQTFKPRLLNDVVQDQYGNLYVTDSLQGSIYFVDHSFKTASLFFQDPVFLPTDQLVGINGVEYFSYVLCWIESGFVAGRI